MEKVENLFFDKIIKEASLGNIDCDFFVPICFGTKELINNEYVDLTVPSNFDNAMIPTLLIKDRKKIVESIYDYVSLAKEFYSDDVRLMDVSCKEKYIISSLLSNALVTDFNDISNLFERHTNFISDSSMNIFEESTNIGYSNILKSNIFVKLNKESIVQETPYGLDIWLEDDNSEVLYDFPTIRFGIDQDKAYIYAFQKKPNAKTDKKIERILRKVGEGFDESNTERDPIENPENLYSINPWSLIALSIAIPLIKNNSNVSSFVAPYFLINRWNSLGISYELIKTMQPDNIEFINKKEEQLLKHDELQRNITDKFIRTFRRMEHHFSNINITSNQLDTDSCLHVAVGEEYKCNNSLLNEVYTLANSNNKNKTR